MKKTFEVTERGIAMTLKNTDTLATAAEVADFLGISVSAVYRLAGDGRLPCIDLGPRMKRFNWELIPGYRAEPEESVDD